MTCLDFPISIPKIPDFFAIPTILIPPIPPFGINLCCKLSFDFDGSVNAEIATLNAAIKAAMSIPGLMATIQGINMAIDQAQKILDDTIHKIPECPIQKTVSI